MDNQPVNDYKVRKENTYVVLGTPVPLSRPRFSESGKVYDAQRSIKNRIVLELKRQSGRQPVLCGILNFNVEFFMPLPKAKASKNHLAQQQYHVYKPDISNLIKFIEDVCIEAHIIEDDAIIASINARKVYSEEPRTEFYFETLVKETSYEE